MYVDKVLPVTTVLMLPWFQHQQQVAAAVERAKQVTMTELNAIIGVRAHHHHHDTLTCPVVILPLVYSDNNIPIFKSGF